MANGEDKVTGGGRLRIGRWLPPPGARPPTDPPHHLGGPAPAAPPPAGPPAPSPPIDPDRPVVSVTAVATDRAGPGVAGSDKDGSDGPRPADLLEPVAGSDHARRRGRWWFVVVPIAAAVLLAVAPWWASTTRDEAPPRPTLSAPVALPELGSPSVVVDPAGRGAPATTTPRSASAAGPSSTTPEATRPGGGAGVTPTTANAPEATLPPRPSGPITGIGGRCVEPAGRSATSGAQIQLGQCDSGTPAQQWAAGDDGTLRTLGSCLHANGTANRTAVTLGECTGAGGQRWQSRSDGTLFNAASGRCLDAEEQSSGIGTRLILRDCTGATNQRWTLG